MVPETRTPPRRVATDTKRFAQSRGKTRALRAVRKMQRLRLMKGLLAAPWLFCVACAVVQPTGKPDLAADGGHASAGGVRPRGHSTPSQARAAGLQVWKDGKVTGRGRPAAAASCRRRSCVDLGEEWVPYIFTERTIATDDGVPQSYRATYLALSRGDFPATITARAPRKIVTSSSTGFLRRSSSCAPVFTRRKSRTAPRRSISSAFKLYQRIVPYIDNPKARRDSSQFLAVEQRIKAADDQARRRHDRQDRRRRSSARATRTRSSSTRSSHPPPFSSARRRLVSLARVSSTERPRSPTARSIGRPTRPSPSSSESIASSVGAS